MHGKRQDYCFNSLILLRHKIVAMSEKEFDTVERVLMREALYSGRIDYSFIRRD